MTENKGDLISRSALRKAFKNHPLCNDVWLQYSRELIDNAPTVCGNNPKWYEHIDKGVLKARHGDYVLYKVDYLLDNLAREVNIMESARKMEGGAES